MTDDPEQTKPKRLPKGWRKYIRRLKQAARRDGVAFRRPSYARVPSRPEPAPAKSRAESEPAAEAE